MLAETVQWLGLTQSLVQRVQGMFPGRRGEAAGHSTPSSIEVKMGEAIPPVPHMPSWHGQEQLYFSYVFLLGMLGVHLQANVL